MTPGSAGDPLAGLVAPADPRVAWDLPDFGSMAPVERLDELTTRVLAPNPSSMTLDGTNTYVIASGGEAVVIDPGPTDDVHRESVEQVLADRDAACVAVVVTHHHHDHSKAASDWARRFGATLYATTPEVAGETGTVVGDGDVVSAGAVTVTAVATPGHCADHVAWRAPTGALLSGDHVLGRGTSVLAHPDGDLVAYLESLRVVLDLGPDALYPGHGPVLREDPTAVVRYYLDHRAFREEQVLALLAVKPRSSLGLVRRIYRDVPKLLWPAAELSTRATLEKLEAEGRIVRRGGKAQLATEA
jgi:glyoxylase-like metal-dependent hydrolase (beta-lactamase superfamily II)